MGTSDERLVEEAVEARILRQSGSHYYAVREEGEDEYVGQGTDEALAYLEEEGYVEPVEEDEEDGADQDTSSSSYDASKTYRHAGDETATFAREGRADGHLYPGGHYNGLPEGNSDIAGLIEEGILRPIE